MSSSGLSSSSSSMGSGLQQQHLQQQQQQQQHQHQHPPQLPQQSRHSSGSGSGSGSGDVGDLPPSAGSAWAANPAARFEKVSRLGAGSFGEAWLVRSKASGRKYVVKEQKINQGMRPGDRDKAMNEVEIIRACTHVNIIRYKDCFVSQMPNGWTIVSIVMEYADAGDLHAYIRLQREQRRGLFSETQIRSWLVQLAFALNYLHERKILHRDVKTQNIFLVRNGLVKLGDFGISKALTGEQDWAMTGIGTPQYLSPEICKMQKYSFKSDVWGLGCVLYELCALKPAFQYTDNKSVAQKICHCQYDPIPMAYSSSMSDLVNVMLRADPARRVSARQVLGSAALEQDVLNYMKYVNTVKAVPGGTADDAGGGPSAADRKGSASSVGSVEGAAVARGSSSSTPASKRGKGGDHLGTLV